MPFTSAQSLPQLAEEARFYWSMLDTTFRLVSLRDESLLAKRQALEKELLILGRRIPGAEAISSLQDLRELLLKKIREGLQQLTLKLAAAALHVPTFERMRDSLDEVTELAALLAGAGTDDDGSCHFILRRSQLACATALKCLGEFVAQCESAHYVDEDLPEHIH